jgi:hypothetical protein
MQWRATVFPVYVCGENLFAAIIQQYAPSNLTVIQSRDAIVPVGPVLHMNAGSGAAG